MELNLQNSSFETMCQEDMVETNGGSVFGLGFLSGILGMVVYDGCKNCVEEAGGISNVASYTFNAYANLFDYLFN